MILNKPASDNNPASDDREPLQHLYNQYLDARMVGDWGLADQIREKWAFPLTYSLPPEKLKILDRDMVPLKASIVAAARLRSDVGKLKKYRYPVDSLDKEKAVKAKRDLAKVVTHSPVARPREGVLFKVGAQDVVVKHQHLNGQWSPKGGAGGGGKRGKITRLSRKARDRMKLHFRNAPEDAHRAMITLTFPRDYTTDGKEVKRYLDLMKRWLKNHGVDCGSWFLEFQRRGAPHFHMYVNDRPAGGTAAIAEYWHNLIGTDDDNHLLWHKGKLGNGNRPCFEWFRVPHAAAFYATKYASKSEQKDVPEQYQDVGRFWGCWGKARPVWRYVSGSGDYALGAARDVVMAFRAAWDTAEGLLAFRGRPMISSTMWGGAKGFDGLLSDAGWCPF